MNQKLILHFFGNYLVRRLSPVLIDEALRYLEALKADRQSGMVSRVINLFDLGIYVDLNALQVKTIEKMMELLRRERKKKERRY